MERLDVRILIVDDDRDICRILATLIEREGFKAIMANDGEPALASIRSASPDLMLLDMRMPNMDGSEVLAHAKELDPDLPVVIITAFGEIHGAVEAIKAGAYDYLTKPFEHDDVIHVVHRALSERELKRKLKNLTSQIRKDSPLRETMGPSESIGNLIAMVERVARSDFTVVIQGETGSGKEVVARAIHKASLRSQGPFVPLDCGAIPDALLESELFGYEKGAFTGAGQRKVGKLVCAQGGTLFLDEVSNLPLSSQAKLLRVIQEKEVMPVGSNKPAKIDVRLLTASNQDLNSLAEAGAFRSDLFFRLKEFTIRVPPLRERRDDIPYLAKRFLDIANAELDKNVKGFSEGALETLLDYPWPGNVREFRSTIRRAVLLADEIITKGHLDVRKRSYPVSWDVGPQMKRGLLEKASLKTIVRESTAAVEREVLTRTLQSTGGNKAKAARILRIDYKTIHTKVKKLGIQTNRRSP
ncbi:MAG TPA: sigma-54 dependent transcriptional regulator [bacterium]|nr:sigma-54 dependent transcriptional regulator [bacterium]